MEPELMQIGSVVPVQWEAEKSAKGPGTLTGWASVYNVVDQQDEIVAPGAFRRALAKWRTGSRVVGLTLDHQNNADGLIGKMIEAEDLPFGLKTTFQFSSTPKAQEARVKAQEGILNGLSFFGPIFDQGFTNRAGKSITVLKEVGLWFVGLTPLPANADALVTAAKAISNTPWSQFSQADYTPEQWRRACLIDKGVGDVDSKERYALPVREPSGTLNRNGVHAAAARLNQVEVSADKKAAAARALIRMYGEMDEDPPDSMRRMAGVMASASLVLPDAWVSDMRSALAISVPNAQKAAVDALVSDLYSIAPVVGDTGDEDTGDEDTGDEDSTPHDAAAAYAVDFLEKSGSGGSPPGGDSVEPLADQLLASIGANQTREQFRAFAAELEELKGKL